MKKIFVSMALAAGLFFFSPHMVYGTIELPFVPENPRPQEPENPGEEEGGPDITTPTTPVEKPEEVPDDTTTSGKETEPEDTAIPGKETEPDDTATSGKETEPGDTATPGKETESDDTTGSEQIETPFEEESSEPPIRSTVVLDGIEKNKKITISLEQPLCATVVSTNPPGTKEQLSARLIKKIKEAVNGDNLRITYVMDEKRSVCVDTVNLKARKSLRLYWWENEKYYMIPKSASTYKVDKNGNLSLAAINGSMEGTYIFVSEQEAKKINQQLLADTRLAKMPKQLKKGKSVRIAFAKTTELSNISKITYSSSNSKVAKVTSKGKVRGKSKGTATITVRVYFKNGDKKSLKWKVSIQ